MAEESVENLVKEEQKIKTLSLGELVEKIVAAALSYNDRLRALDGRGSPYASENELRQRLLEEYRRIVNPIIEELNRREQIYSNK